MKNSKLKNILFSLLAILLISIIVTENTSAQITTNNGFIYFQNQNQSIRGNGSHTIDFRSNHNTTARINFHNNANTRLGSVYGYRNPSDGSRYFGFTDADGNWSYITKTDSWTAFVINSENKMVLRANGQVNIPSTRDASGTVGSGTLEIGGGLRLDNNEIITNTNTALYFNYDNNGDVVFDANTLRVDASTDRVGIGTASPSTKFDVNGRATCHTSFTIGEHNDSYRGLVVDNAGSYAWKLMELKNVQGTRMIVLGNGNVGIGTTNPTYKLSVNGNIRAKEVRVETGWSDYVFYDDYQLPTLEEEEQHIEEKGHLLGFESEEAMGGEALLGDVSKRQQAKIEEMMLHLIQINEKLESVESKVTDLEQENTQLKKQLIEQK